MIGFGIHIALFLLFVFLFFRQDRLDKRAFLKRDMEGDLHILNEMKKFLEERGEDTARMDAAIVEMKEKLNEF